MGNTIKIAEQRARASLAQCSTEAAADAGEPAAAKKNRRSTAEVRGN